MSSDQFGQGLGHWQSFLSAKPLPVMASSHGAIMDAMEDEDASLYHLAQLMRPCPVICFHVFCAVNLKRSDEDPRVFNLEHALSLLGIGPLQELLNSLKTITPEDSKNSLLYCSSITTSYHAACLASAWYRQLKRETEEAAYWFSLFAQMVRWSLWLHAPDVMTQLHHQQKAGGDPYAHERRTLGCTIDELATAMDEHWPRPCVSATDWQQFNGISARNWLSLSRIATKPSHKRHTQSPQYDRYLHLLHDNKSIKLISNSPCAVVVLANMVALHSQDSWYDNQMSRLMRLLALFTNLDVGEAAQLCHRVAIETSHHQHDWLLPPPAAGLIWPIQQRRHSLPAINEQPHTAQATQPRKPDIAHFKTIYNKLTSQPEQIKNLPELVELLGDALHNGLGFERVVIALPNKERTRLISFRRFGDNGHLKFTIDLSPPSLFRAIMLKPSAIWVKGPTQRAIWQQIPASFRDLVAGEQFLLRSLFVNDRSVALLYADMAGRSQGLTDKHYQHFQTLCKAATPTLLHLASNPPKNR